MGKEFKKWELEQGSFTAGTKKYKDREIISNALSPRRLKKVLQETKRRFPVDFETLNVAKIVNEKCRKRRKYDETHA